MTLLLQISINFSAFNCSQTHFGSKLSQPTSCFSHSRRRNGDFQESGLKLGVLKGKSPLLGDGVWVTEKWRKNKRVVLVRFNQGFGFNNGNGGGGDNGNNGRILTNLALAVGLTYLSVTGQLGWVLDAIVSVWLFVIILPIVGLGAFIWWAGRDIVQSACPNCGNDFQIFKSAMKDEVQLCPFCTQPFSVDGDEFVREPVKFSNEEESIFNQVFNDLSPRSKKGMKSSTAVVDVEAEIKDVD